MASEPLKHVVAGGGAAGFFAAIACAEADPSACVSIYEAQPRPLGKVRISGGGRCNVTNACTEPAVLVANYPRGGRELLGPFHRWQPRDTMAWFEDRGIELKTEPDGRVFPASDDSGTIIDCLRGAAAKAGVKLHLGCGVEDVARGESGRGYRVKLFGGGSGEADTVLLATGGGQGSAGLAIAGRLGHAIEPPVPSLFTFHVADPRIRDLPGVAVPAAALRIAGSGTTASGPVLVTHGGLSGPGVLKLSAWGARELALKNYRFTLEVSWVGDRPAAAVRSELAAARSAHPARRLVTWNPAGIPSRLWERLLAAAAVPAETLWAAASNAALDAIASQLTAGKFEVSGKSTNKEEFVTCGGVRLSEVDFKTMQSRISPGLFLAGEVLDIDGLTGGFNLQAAWTTGRLAGLGMAARRRV